MGKITVIDITYDGCVEPIHCEKIADTIYRCLESGLFLDFINYECEIEVEVVDGKPKFLWLFKESPYTTCRYVCSKAVVESEGCEKMKREIELLNGHWENIMGGVFIIHLPNDKADELERLVSLLPS